MVTRDESLLRLLRSPDRGSKKVLNSLRVRCSSSPSSYKMWKRGSCISSPSFGVKILVSRYGSDRGRALLSLYHDRAVLLLDGFLGRGGRADVDVDLARGLAITQRGPGRRNTVPHDKSEFILPRGDDWFFPAGGGGCQTENHIGVNGGGSLRCLRSTMNAALAAERTKLFLRCFLRIM